MSDGKNIYAFFSKSGIFCYTLSGEQLWHTLIGDESSNRQWGSAASPILLGDQLIVNASDEARSVISLDKKTGNQLWKAEADLTELSYGTPGIVHGTDRREVVLAIPGEVWGLNAETGKLAWYAKTN